jgi:uncharacterized protein YqjF (DUF2071 family)
MSVDVDRHLPEARAEIGWQGGPPWEAPHAINRPVMVHRWENLSFLHWPYEPAAVERLLPPGLQADTFDGRAWVGLIPFRLTVMPLGLPAVPWLSSCPEINVRTYVRGPNGRSGIWFLSLEASRLPAVALARGWYRLPYMWAWMRTERCGREVTYRSGRRIPRRMHPTEVITVRIDDPVAPADLGPLDLFLTARFRMYSPLRTGLAVTEVHHRPWPLWRAEAVRLHDELISAVGLPDPEEPPVAHFSTGVITRFGPRLALNPA